VAIQAGGVPLFLTFRSVIRVFDWDGDGLKDLVCSSDVGVYWCRNTNSNANVILQAPEVIKAPVAGSGLMPIATTTVPGARMRLDLVDWDNDGVIDLLIGDATGKVYLFQGYRFAVNQVACQPDGRAVLRWNSAPYVSYNVLGKSDVINLPWATIATVPSGGKTTCWTNSLPVSNQFYRIQVAQ
jgi:hypothetical protein